MALTGCGGSGSRLLRAAANPIELVWRPWYRFPNGDSRAAVGAMYEGIAPWLRANPGVSVRLTTVGYQRETVASMLAGTGPDVFEDWVLPLYVQADLLLDLTAYMRRDGVNAGLFPPFAMNYLTTTGRDAPAGAGLFGLPAFTDTLTTVVNEGLLGDLGLALPEPDWGYAQWTDLWRAATRRSSDPSRQRYGGQLSWSGYDYSGGNPAPFYLHGFGGEYVDPQQRTRCALDAPGSVACLSWAYSLLRDGVVGGSGVRDFALGRQATALLGSGGSLPSAASSWQSLRWDFYPMPIWPHGRMTYASSDFYGIWSGTTYPDVAWDFLRFLCVDPTWQRWMMKLALVAPNQPRLQDEWAAVVRGVAPTLRRKNLALITDGTLGGQPYIGASFRYEEQASANVIARYSGLAQAGELSVAAAASRAAQGVNALQAGGSRVEALAVARMAEIEEAALSPRPIVLPPPPASGSGVPAERSPYVRSVRGTVTLLGDGAALGGHEDNCLFTAVPGRDTRASYLCRLVVLANVSCPRLSAWSAAGLMVRGDLSGAAATLAVAATGGNGLRLQIRRRVGGVMRGIGPTSLGEAQGLMGSPFLTRSLEAWWPNYLLQPVWLRLDRHGVRWTAYSSWDGNTWTQAGPTQVVELASAWVGVFACAHNVDFGSRYYVRGGFDHLNFATGPAYQIGRRGVVPAAGPVPPEWESD